MAKRYYKKKRNKVDNYRGKLRPNIEMPKEKHLRYIPLIREHFNLDESYTILKDYQIYDDACKGNWLIMKDKKICFVLFNDYAKKLFKGVADE